MIKIRDSNPAIEFLVVAKPDEWEKHVKNETRLSNRQLEYEKFWLKLVNRFKETYPNIKPAMWSINRSYLIMCYEAPGLEYTLKFSHGSFLINLYIKGNVKMHPHEIIDRLITRKDYIEDELEAEVEFDKKEGVNPTKVNLYCNAKADILSISETEKDFLIDWSIKWMPKFKKTLQSIINEIE